MREKIYSWFFYQPMVKTVGSYLLNQPWFINNPLYQYFQNRYIEKVIRRYQKAPNLVVIENTNLCNSHCSMCPHDIMKRRQGIMKMELYRKIIDECVKIGVKKINLHNFGEPLIDKDFVKRVEYAKSKGIVYVSTSTNAALLNDKLAEAIITSGLDAINFSLDAYSRRAYEKTRVGLPYDTVMNNVRRFIKKRHQLGYAKPQVVVDFIKTDINQKEEHKFVRRWHHLADRVNVTTLHGWAGSYKEKMGEQKFHHSVASLKREPCRFLWTDMVINWDGRVSACCQDYDVNMVVGDVNKNTVGEVWRGKALEGLRNLHLSGEIASIPLCRQCDYRSVWWLFK